MVSAYTPDEYERTSYYNGITGDGDHPELVYRSDFLTTPFPKPVGRHAHIPVKSLRGVFDTPLNGVWDTVGPEIRDLIKARKINWSSVDPARFFTHGPPGEEEKGSLGPVVIWVGVIPGSTSSDTAHEVSQEILMFLLKNGVEDAVVEWREAVPQRLAGPPLMRHVGSNNATHYVRHSTLWFHENKDKDGNPSDKVYGVSNCHVLRKDTAVEYEYRGGAPTDHVRVCGMRRFQRGLDEIKKVIGDHAILADLRAREIVKLQAKERQDEENAKEIRANRRNLEDENEAIADLEAFYDEVTKYWSDPFTVDVEGSTLYTSDWAAFLAAEAKVKAEFEGNVIDLGSKYSPQELTAMFYPLGGGATTFKFPERKLRIEGCAIKEDLANPVEFDNEGQRCLIVGKDGNTTDLTVGRYAGLVSFTLNEVGIESVELGIYNSSVKTCIVGQRHSGNNKGGSTSNHVTYCNPGWYFLDQIRKKFKHADFYRTTWSA
ncbi:hypothetical protein FISHEDRAFT_63434 [Fistulina hepatica ATCC 64428]|uniref:Uncharacterized protein n=1 Tax=Fistulina hepatica ATCC 64428 TaxID=1128425 RepID=A0A0D7ANY0_9AGAR|nr:hypothetical protein FISHEDRAFT_63434 [Fistulina hepatica ATCC 64428]